MAINHAEPQSLLSTQAASHPKLRPLIERLAALPTLTFDDAQAIIEAACRDLNISSLDLQMIQPGAQIVVPFAPSAGNTPGEQHQDAVSAHVRRLIQEGKSR